MPYKKRYKKRRGKNLLGSYNKYVSAASKTALLAMQVYKLKSLINVEQKFFDVSSASTAIPDGVGTIVQLTNIGQGDTDITRDGSQIKLTSWSFKAIITSNTSAADTGTSVAVFLIEDKQTNGAIYTTADLLASVTNVLSVVSSLNLDNKFRFKIHKRWILDVNLAGKARRTLQFYKKFGNDMKLRFDANSPAITDLTSKSLSLLFISNEATNTPTITFFNRLRFVDN